MAQQQVGIVHTHMPHTASQASEEPLTDCLYTSSNSQHGIKTKTILLQMFLGDGSLSLQNSMSIKHARLESIELYSCSYCSGMFTTPLR